MTNHADEEKSVRSHLVKPSLIGRPRAGTKAQSIAADTIACAMYEMARRVMANINWSPPRGAASACCLRASGRSVRVSAARRGTTPPPRARFPLTNVRDAW